MHWHLNGDLIYGPPYPYVPWATQASEYMYLLTQFIINTLVSFFYLQGERTTSSRTAKTQPGGG